MPPKSPKNEAMYHLECFDCKKQTNETESVTSCPKCGGPLIAKYNFDKIKSRINLYDIEHAPISAVKYLNFYPINDFEKVISLREGGTPLIRARNLGKKYNLNKLYLKNEGANPTGVFKDRGTLVEVTKAIELGAKAICLASTGNMAASVAAYSSIAGIPCYVLVPEGTPIGKLAQTLSYHARIIQVRGTYSDCAKLAEKMAEKHGFYLAGDYVFRREGQKSQGYEIVEQLFWKAPDYVVVPVGCGTNSSAIWQGFLDFKELGLINHKLPKMIVVQPEGCNTIVGPANKKSLEYKVVDKPNSVCSAVAAGCPLDGHIILKAVRDSGGFGVEVTDNEALKAQQSLAKNEGIFAEPSGALPMSAIKKLTEKKFFKPDDVIVAVITGNGLKDPVSATKILPSPPSIEPNMEEIDNYLKYKIYNIRGHEVDAAKKVLFRKKPSTTEIRELIEKDFDLKLNKNIVQKIKDELETFISKGKAVTHYDFQNIVEEVVNAFTAKEKILEVTDFEVAVSKKAPNRAEVEVKFNGKLLKSRASGVGPFDAIMKAMQQIIKKQKGIKVTLQDFNVEIDEGGTDAVVKVTIVFTDENNNKVVVSATSPDIIVASVNAFEKGYNLLWWKNKS
jgi:threonine synthase